MSIPSRRGYGRDMRMDGGMDAPAVNPAACRLARRVKNRTLPYQSSPHCHYLEGSICEVQQSRRCAFERNLQPLVNERAKEEGTSVPRRTL